jgi:uncharacterized membrane protein YbhN (UPF0104 family)
MTRDSHPTAPPLRVRLWSSLLLLLLLGLAVHLLLPQLTSLNHSLQVLKAMPLWIVALAVAAQVLSYLGSGYLLQAIVATAGQRLSVVRGTLITMAAYSVGLVAGGSVGIAAATYRWVSGSGVSAEGAVLAGWLPNLFNAGVLIIAAFLGMMVLLIVRDLAAWQVASFGLTVLVLGLIGGAVAWGMRYRSHLSRLAVGISARWARLRRRAYDPAATEEAVGRLFGAWDTLRVGGWRGPALGAGINVVFDMLTLYFLFLAAGPAVSPGTLLAGYGLPLLLAKVTFLPGGVGIVEGTMAALYGSLGVPAAVTVVVILTYRFLSFWLPSLLGFPLVPFLQRASRRVANDAAQAAEPPARDASKR